MSINKTTAAAKEPVTEQLRTAALVVVCLAAALSVHPVSAAENTEPLIADWSDFQSSLEEAGYAGYSFEPAEVPVRIWIPDTLWQTELTEEDREEGYIGYFENEEEGQAMAVMYVDMGGMDLDAYIRILEEEDATGIRRAQINGTEAVFYDIEAEDTAVASFAADDGYNLELSFRPASDASFMDRILYTVFSVRKAE